MRANKDNLRDVLVMLTDRMSNNESLGRWRTVRCGVLNIYVSDHIENTRHKYLVSAFYKEKVFFTMTYTEQGTIAKLRNSQDTDFWAIELFAQWLAVLKYCTDLNYYIDSVSTVDKAREQYLKAMIEAEAPVTRKDDNNE